MDLEGYLLSIFFCTPIYLKCPYGLLSAFLVHEKFSFLPLAVLGSGSCFSQINIALAGFQTLFE